MEAARELRTGSERRPINLSGHAILENGSTTSVTLLDLSYDGCGIESAAELRPGETIKLSVLRRGGIHAQVRWYSHGKAGLVFDPPMTDDEAAWPPRNDRIPVSADVSLRRQGKLNYQVRVVDASPQGCKVEFIERPQMADRVWIKFDGLELMEAQVCWIDGFSAGLQYTRAIHPAVFDLLLQRMV